VDTIVKFIKRDDVQLYATLLFLIAVIFLFRSMISVILLTTIFAYLAVKSSDTVARFLHLPYALSVFIVYGLVIFALYLAFVFVGPVLYEQFAGLPKAVMAGLKEYPVIEKYVSDFIQQMNWDEQLSANWKDWLSTGFEFAKSFGDSFVRFLLAVFMSLVFALTRFRLNAFGHQFLTSEFPRFFKNIYFLGAKFVEKLGQIIETQLKIDLINSVLMVSGFYLIGMPSPMVLGVIVLILGVIPVAGVLISLIPLSVMAFSDGGIWLMVYMIILTIIVHLFESYFLHPRMMATRTELPIFVTFITLIVMEQVLGPWGLITGVPIVAFFLDIMGVESGHTKVVYVSENQK
jgi:predicted PurR-regulated permease PerM